MDQKSGHREKKQYSPPNIKRWGTVADLTKAGAFEEYDGRFASIRRRYRRRWR
jgi:hypothetical protein